MNEKTAIIVQARLGSSRLPGKILRPVGGLSVLEQDVRRLKRVRGADCVVVATTDRDSDTVVAEAAATAGAIVFRGDEADVLGRYLGAARSVDAGIIMRVTSDCPLIDADICSALLALRAETGADYAANNMPRLYPHGLDCEVFTRVALERAATEARDAYDREHVTPWLRRQPDLKRAALTGPGWPANQQRWTLDFPEDLDFLAGVFDLLPRDRVPSWQEVLSLIGQNPALARPNARHRAASPMSGDDTAPVAVFRFEANARIGSGHAMRCNTLLSCLENLGWRCHWAVSGSTEEFLENAIPPGALIRIDGNAADEDAGAIAAAIGQCDLMVVDHYGDGAGIGFHRAARRFSRLVACFDDLANRELDADFIINATPGFAAADYGKLNRRPASILLGADMAPLRQQFSARRAARLKLLEDPGPRGIARILVAFGAVDPLDGTGLALEALAGRGIPAIDVVLGGSAPHLGKVRGQVAAFNGSATLHTDVADMAELMAAADLVIGAPGISTFERACLCLPSLLVGIAGNQRANADMVARSGAGLVAGFLTEEPRADVAMALSNLLGAVARDTGLLRRMALSSANLCDGRGTQRLVIAFLPEHDISDGRSLRLCPVEARHEALLLNWQSAPGTRRFALNPRIPGAAEHHAWLAAKLASDRDWILLGMVGDDPAGYVRLDWRGEDRGRPQYLVSIATAPGWYRCGVGRALLAGARSLAPGARLIAKVLPENVASVALFGKAGYRLAEDGYFHSPPPQRKED